MCTTFTTYVHRFLVTVASHPQEEECVACYTEEEKRTETSKQVRKYDKYKKSHGRSQSSDKGLT